MAEKDFKKVREIFHIALEKEPQTRNAYILEACGEDENLVREVESLFSSFDEMDGFLETPAVAKVADVIEPETEKIEAGKRFSHYEIIEQIGTGGMGEVYLARDKKLDRKVAVKILNEKFSRDESNLNRFIREAKAASTLNHQNILVIHEIGESDDTHYIVSEYIKGKTLRQILREKTLNLSEILDITIQIAAALDAAHEAHLVHRDIKPENVMIRPDGLVKILDFGLAKLVAQNSIGFEESTVKQNETAQGVILGTVQYMSPEQAKGKKIDERTDIFSFGVVMYEMLAGRAPFAGESVSETVANLINSDPPPLAHFVENMPDELQRTVGKTLRKKRDERYQTIKGLLTDLKDLRENLAFNEHLEKSHPPNESNKTKFLQAATGETGFQTAETQNSLPQKIRRHKTATLAALAMMVAALAVGGYFAFFAPHPPITSIAVLPFENASGDASLDYLSDGLSESLIDKLSQLPQLKVIARNSSFKFRGANIDVQDAASKLGVRAIVMGKFIRIGDNLIVRVEMIDAAENRQLWSEQYNRKASDLLFIQQEIAQMASQKLHLKLSGEQERQLAKRETVSPQAYDLLLKGRYYYIRSGTDAQRKAAEYFEQAVALDPNYALAYADLSLIYSGLAINGIADPKVYLPKAESTARKALELDENLAEAHVAMSGVYINKWQWQEGESERKRAIELDSNNARAHFGYSYLLTLLGRHDESIAELKRAKELDPLSPGIAVGFGHRLHFARRHDEAIAVLKKALESAPDHDYAYFFLGYAYAAKGQFKEAIAAYQEAIRLGNNVTSIQIYLGAAYARGGERGKTQTILKQLQNTKQYVSPCELAILYGALEDKEAAFQSLEKAYSEHDLQLTFLKVDPAFDPLRDDPRFQDLLRRVGLHP